MGSLGIFLKWSLDTNSTNYSDARLNLGTSLTSELKGKQREFDNKFEKNFNVDNKVF